MKTNAAKSALLGIAAAALAGTANAAPAVTIDGVAQRWPWNTLVSSGVPSSSRTCSCVMPS